MYDVHIAAASRTANEQIVHACVRAAGSGPTRSSSTVLRDVDLVGSVLVLLG